MNDYSICKYRSIFWGCYGPCGLAHRGLGMIVVEWDPHIAEYYSRLHNSHVLRWKDLAKDSIAYRTWVSHQYGLWQESADNQRRDTV